MKRLWEELNTLHAKTQCNCNCTCRAKDNMFKVNQDRGLIQFLMGLNEIYTVIRGNILMMNPLPSLPQTFSLLIQEENKEKLSLTLKCSWSLLLYMLEAQGRKSLNMLTLMEMVQKEQVVLGP